MTRAPTKNAILRRYTGSSRPVLEGMARALWSRAWVMHSSDEDVPPTPDAAYIAADVLARGIENMNGPEDRPATLHDLAMDAARAHGGGVAVRLGPAALHELADQLGEALAMEAMGTGRWHRAAFPHEVPRFSVKYDGSYLEWTPRDPVGALRPNPAAPFQSSADFIDALESVDERVSLHEGAARKVQAAADEIAAAGGGWNGGDKVFISDVAAKVGSTTERLARLLLIGRAKGWVSLARADMPSAMDSSKVAASEVRSPSGDSVHFVERTRVVPPSPAPRPLPRGRVGERRSPPAAAGRPGELTIAQIYGLRRHYNNSLDFHGLAIVDAALSPNETTDKLGDELVDYDGNPITRTRARARVAKAWRDRPIEPILWFYEAVNHDAGRAEWTAIADAVEATIRPPDPADLAARVRIAREKAREATQP